MRRSVRAPLATIAARPVGAAVVGALCIAFSGIFVRLADVAPTTAAAYRCIYALPPLGVLAWIERARFGPRSRRAHVLAAFAGLAFTADLIIWHHAIDAVGAGLATVLGNLQVLMVALLAWLLLRERPDARILASLPLVIVGVVFVSGVVGAGAYGDDPGKGVILGVGTSLAYAAFILIHREGAKDLRRPAGPLFEATLVTSIASLAYGALDGTIEAAPVWPGHGWLILLALTAQVAGWLFLSVSLPRLPAALTSVLLLLQPVGSLVLSAAILDENPSVAQIGGVALILAGVVLAARRRAAGTPPAAIPEPATP